MISKSTLKKMKEDTLETLNLYQLVMETRQQLDERDYKVINDYIRSSRNLRELNLTNSNMGLEHMDESLKQNKSLKRLNLSSVVYDENVSTVVGILRANTGISEVNLDNCQNISAGGLAILNRYFKTHNTFTHIHTRNVNYNYQRQGHECDLSSLYETLRDSPNILQATIGFGTGSEVIERLCETNRERAITLIKKAQNVDDLTVLDIQDIQKRLPAFLSVAETESIGNRTAIAQMLINIEDAAAAMDVKFEIPAHYAPLANTLPRPFHPSEEKVNFEKLSADKLDSANIYKAVEAGQVDDLLTFMRAYGKHLTAADCLLKPEGKKENMIEVAARQSALPAFMSAATWSDNPREFKQVANAVPTREWDRQMKEMTIDMLLSEVNVVSFKKAHQGPKRR